MHQLYRIRTPDTYLVRLAAAASDVKHEIKSIKYFESVSPKDIHTTYVMIFLYPTTPTRAIGIADHFILAGAEYLGTEVSA